MALSPTSSRSSGGSSALAVTDGVHSVASVATLDFTAGVVVSDAGGGQANASVTGAAITFTPTATKTANYSAAANEYVVGDSTGGAFTVTLPAAPTNGTVVAVQQIGSANAITVAAGAGDTINAATNTSIGLTRRSAMYQYRASDKVWFALAPATNPVLSFAADGTTIVNTGTATAPNVHTGTLDVIAANQAPVAAVAMNSQKLTGLAAGSANGDSVRYEQSPAAILTAAGDIIYASGANTPVRLAKGADGTVLTLAAGVPSWAAAAAGFFAGARYLTYVSSGNYGLLPYNTLGAGPNTDGLMMAIPFVLMAAITVSEIDVKVNSGGGASSTCRVGIYSDNGSFHPGARLVDFGTVAANTTGIKTITGLSTALSAGVVYWLAAVPQGQGGAAPQMVGLNPALQNPNLGNNNAGDYFNNAAGTTTFGGYAVTAVSGALPDPYGAGALTSAASMPATLFKAT